MKHYLLQTSLKELALHSLNTLSDVGIKVFMLLFQLSHSVYYNPSLLCLVLLISVVINFQLIVSFSFN